jgi:putative flippase GtrA
MTWKWPKALAGKLGARAGSSAMRYLAVVLGGFVVDLATAFLSHTFLGLPLLPAAMLGFGVALTLSYFVHEYWTFRRETSAVSGARFLKFVFAAGFTLAARLMLVWATGLLGALPGGDLARLLIAYGGSLLVGFFLNRGAVFGDAAGNSEIEPR